MDFLRDRVGSSVASWPISMRPDAEQHFIQLFKRDCQRMCQNLGRGGSSCARWTRLDTYAGETYVASGTSRPVAFQLAATRGGPEGAHPRHLAEKILTSKNALDGERNLGDGAVCRP